MNLACNEVATLLIKREDCELSADEVLSLGSHIQICEDCEIFSRQILVMRGAMASWRNYTGNGQ